MMDAAEKMNYVGEVSVLLGERNYFTIPDSEGMLILREYFSCSNGVYNVRELLDGNLTVNTFDLHYLHSPESLLSLLDRHIRSQIVFLDNTRAWALTIDILKYLVSNFRFTTVPDSSHSRKPKIIIVVDVHVEQEMNSFLPKEDFSADEAEQYNNFEYVEVEQQEMEENHEEEHDCEPGTEDEDLMDDTSNVSNMVEEEDCLESAERQSYLEKLCSLLDSYMDDSEPIAMDELEEIFKQVETKVRTNTLTDDDKFVAECSICLQLCLSGTEVATMPCSHVFHSDCIFKWLKKYNSCPMCRALCATEVKI